MIREYFKHIPMYFSNDNEPVLFQDFVNAIKSSGVNRGDTIITHVDLGAFGKLGQITNRKDFVNVFIEIILNILGENGTLIVPTYSYSFCNNKIFNPLKTPSEVGYFSEEFRKKKGVIRSVHPLFSVASIGKNAQCLVENISKNSFGDGSVFDKLRQIKNSKYVVIGVSDFMCSHVHYIEEKQNVPYRYVKIFRGQMEIDGRMCDDEYEYFVRDLNLNVNTTFDKIENHLLDKGYLKKVKVGDGFIRTVKINDLLREGINMLENDPLCFLENNPYE